MKMCGVVQVYFHMFLISALGGGEWSGSYPCRFTQNKEENSLFGRQSRYEYLWRKRNILPLQGIEFRVLDCSVHSLVSILTELSRRLFCT
jgi:hypothetical protein